ncbi:MAG: hypothetical protein H7Z14_04365 [Anaerolineae bacterium]|nr:hypothetical protein [Phycisphaerae bacterium]
MDSSHIKPKQAMKLCQAVRRSLAYVGRLRRRMELLGFPPDDVLYRAASKAHDGLQELHVRAHYCSVPSGVGVNRTADGSKPAPTQ